MLIAAIVLSITVVSFGSFSTRTAARSAAQIFARDLSQARAMAVRTRAPVVVRFEEDSLTYRIVTENGTLMSSGVFTSQGEIELDEIDLVVRGDSVVFDGNGAIDWSAGATVEAEFSVGGITYEVEFNATGSSVVREQS